MESKLIITKEEYDNMNKIKEDLIKLRESRNKWTKTYINKIENKDKLKEKRREYAKRSYEKNKNNEEFMLKKREQSLTNYYKKKNKVIT